MERGLALFSILDKVLVCEKAKLFRQTKMRRKMKILRRIPFGSLRYDDTVSQYLFFSVIAPMRKALPLSWKIAFDKTEKRAYTKITK